MNDVEKPIRVVIADDEEGMRLIWRKVLSAAQGFELVAEGCNGKELVALVEAHRPQLVCLDVEMPEMTGVEAARMIQDLDPATVMIFATAHDQYRGDAFEVYAFDYLLKPFKLERINQTLARVREALTRRAQEKPLPPLPLPSAPTKALGRLMLKGREAVQLVDMEDILLVQREERATAIYTAGGGRFVTGEALGEMEKRLDPQLFFRCHKSYIINLRHIDNISPYGRWTYIAKLKGTSHDALITHEKYDQLERMFA